MGEEISESHYSKNDFVEFEEKLREETRLLKTWFEQHVFDDEHVSGGFELEAWLVDEHYRPAPENEVYLTALNDPLAVPELAKFNVELNGSPQTLQGNALKRMDLELQQTWQHCSDVADNLGLQLLMTGILPTVRDQDLTLANMSRMVRYQALNEQVMRIRKGRPLNLDIHGREHLCTEHHDVMLEAAATSFQIHLQVPLSQAACYYNLAIILSAPMVAISANSPYLFGKDLWEETRIPLFEQAVEVGGLAGAAFGPTRRVSFGTGYARESLFECFEENLEHFPILLPVHYSDPPERMSHLRLQNGTIWRWNRPLIGFNEDGTPHLRIEHRVTSSGPSITDMIANSALFYGLITDFGQQDTMLETAISFAQARDNFYAAAKQGLQAMFSWQGQHINARTLLLEELLPLAHRGLERLEIAQDDIEHYLGVIEARVKSGCNGAHWQRMFVEKHGRDMQALTAAYMEQQKSGLPVHEWEI